MPIAATVTALRGPDAAVFFLVSREQKKRPARLSRGRAVAGRPGMRSRTRTLICVLEPERAAGAALFELEEKGRRAGLEPLLPLQFRYVG